MEEEIKKKVDEMKWVKKKWTGKKKKVYKD